MWISPDPKKFSYQYRWHEVAVYSGKNNKLYRLQEDGIPVFVEIDKIEELRSEYNNTGIYLSVFAHKEPSVDSESVLGPLYFDFDSSDLRHAQADARKLYRYLRKLLIDEQNVQIFFSGGKGFHIECEPLALGIGPSNNLHQVFRLIATELADMLTLESLDFSVYDKRRMWRLVNSRHQGTGLFKVAIRPSLLDCDPSDIQDYATREVPLKNVEPTFQITANEWYREYTYKIEAESKNVPMLDLKTRFERDGSSKTIEDSAMKFNPMCFEAGCKTLGRLYDKAETEKHLEHEERLFLCSLLTYTDEAIYYLHHILSNLSDYSWEKSESHIRDWIRRREYEIGGRPYSCQRANEAGVGCGDCDLEPRKKRVKINGRWIETEVEAMPSPIRFVYDRG